jgi:maltokinase
MSLEEQLLTWLPRQRWFGGKGRRIRAVAERSSAQLTESGRLVVLHVDYADGGSDGYQLLLGSTTGVLEQRLEHAVIGTADGATLYDAAYDPAVSSALLGHLASGGEWDGLSFVNAAEIDASLTSRVMGAEQSNTSLVFGDTYILKLFRRLQPGANPDIEVTQALGDAGSTHIACPLA